MPTDRATLASITTDAEADRYMPSCRSQMLNLASDLRRAETDHDQALDQVLLPLGIREGARFDPEYFFKPKATLNYPYEKNPLSPAFEGSMRFAAIRRRGTLHRVQAVRSRLPGRLHHDRGRAA
jgi:hypothetical protein